MDTSLLNRRAVKLLSALLIAVAALLAWAGISPAAYASDAVSYQSYTITPYREAAYGTPPNAVSSLEGCHFVISAKYPDAVNVVDADAAAKSFTFGKGTVEDMNIYSVSATGDTLNVDITTTYMPGGVMTIQSDRVDGVTCNGGTVKWDALTTVIPTGLKFHVTSVTVGTADTCASTTIEIDHQAVIRSMNHILWTSNGSSIVEGTGTAQTSPAHHHFYWQIDLKASAGFVQMYAGLGSYGYTVTTTEDGYGVTITANKPKVGEYLGIYNYDDNFLQEYGFSLNDHVEGLPVQQTSDVRDISARANFSISSAEYTGQPVKPEIEVTDGRYGTLVEGIDYVTAYTNNVEFGSGTITFTGIGAYTGTVTESFAISKTIKDSDFNFDLSDVTYTGQPVEGRVTSSTLKEGEDYIVRYTSNVNVGTANIYVIGQGCCQGNVTKTFKIVAPAPASLAKAKVKLAVGKRCVTASWGKVTGAVSYKVQYRLKGAGSWKTKSCKSAKLKISKLKKGKKYQVRVITVGAGVTSTSAVVTSKKIK